MPNPLEEHPNALKLFFLLYDTYNLTYEQEDVKVIDNVTGGWCDVPSIFG